MNTPDLVRRLESLRSYITGLSAEAPAIRNQAAILINDTIAALASAAEVPSPDKADAARYRWLRSQHWSAGAYCVAKPAALKLGVLTYSMERLDAIADEGITRSLRLEAGEGSPTPPQAGADGAVGVAP